MSISVQIASRVPGIPTPQRLRRWALSALDVDDASLTIRVVNAAEARYLNHAYRDKNYATNVLTFAYSSQPVEADIVLCAQVVAAEARAQGKTLDHHYAHLTVHGVLHARGLDHERPTDARRMEALEVEILGKLKIPNPYL